MACVGLVLLDALCRDEG